MTRLAGGVSNRTVLVERTSGPSFVVKQALPRLRVATEWFSDPKRSQREALGLKWLERLAPRGTIPCLLFQDDEHHLLAMEAVPQPHENWKDRLLGGSVEEEYAEQFGKLLGAIHAGARGREFELADLFDDRSFFRSLRLEPYYEFAAIRNPSSAGFYADLIAETLATRLTLVHGDYSPKNILIYQSRLILLDHEVIHWGDPAFDLGFSLTHLLSKAHHLPAHRTEFTRAAESYWQAYRPSAGAVAASEDYEARVVRHTLGCLLARVDGRSPLEYLSNETRDRQRAIVLEQMNRPPDKLTDLIGLFELFEL